MRILAAEASDLCAVALALLLEGDIVQTENGPALERLFDFEALALAHQAGGNSAAHAQAVALAQASFDALDAGDRGWCQATLDRLLQGLPAPAST